MSEKRRLLQEMEKVFKKVDDGVVEFQEILDKLGDANSDNQREKFQDELKAQIKRLQRLREQIKGWQTSPELKAPQEKESLNKYRRIVEERMELFKDIEREAKTRPHSKQGLSSEEKKNPIEEKKNEAIDWVNLQIRRIQDEIDRTEAKLEVLDEADGGGRRRKRDDSDEEERLKNRLASVKFHVEKLEIIMRMFVNDKLDVEDTLEVIKEPIECYINSLDPESTDAWTGGGIDDYDPKEIYEALDLQGVTLAFSLRCPSRTTESISAEGGEGEDSGDWLEAKETQSYHHYQEQETPHEPRTPQLQYTLSEQFYEHDTEDEHDANLSQLSMVHYFSDGPEDEAETLQHEPLEEEVELGGWPKMSPSPSITQDDDALELTEMTALSIDNDDAGDLEGGDGEGGDGESGGGEDAESDSNDYEGKLVLPLAPPPEPLSQTTSTASGKGTQKRLIRLTDNLACGTLSANWWDSFETELLDSPPPMREQAAILDLLAEQVTRLPIPMDSEPQRRHMPGIPFMSPLTELPPDENSNKNAVEYYIRQPIEELFLTFYYHEGTVAQLLAAKALKRLYWRFHTQLMTWLKRQGSPKAITEDYEEGDFLYFDYEMWELRNKHNFIFEYRYLEDYEL